MLQTARFGHMTGDHRQSHIKRQVRDSPGSWILSDGCRNEGLRKAGKLAARVAAHQLAMIARPESRISFSFCYHLGNLGCFLQLIVAIVVSLACSERVKDKPERKEGQGSCRTTTRLYGTVHKA